MNQSDSQLDTSVLLINAEGIIVAAQENICAALGWAHEELVGQAVSELFEYGGDLLIDQLNGMQGADAPDSFSASALLRKKDQTHFPATVIVRRKPDLSAFGVSFDDLPSEVSELLQPQATIPTEVASAIPPQTDSVRVVVEPVVAPQPDISRAVPLRITEPAPTLPKSVERPDASNGGNTSRFRNIFLSSPQRTNDESNGENGQGAQDIVTQLENERQERKRLEARVLALNDQLQQLHVQLKNNLETENIYHKRIDEAEEAVRKAEQGRVAAEVALCDQKKEKQRVEENLAQLQNGYARFEEERKAWQQEWSPKLEAALKALQESDARLEKEIAARRGFGVALQMLQQDFSSHTKKETPDFSAIAPKADVDSDSDDQAVTERQVSVVVKN